MRERPPLGEQQLEVLRFVSDHAPITVSEVVRRYREPRGSARTTILTVIEKLREKGYLARAKVEGVFHYSPRQEASDLLRDLVQIFVEKSLGGSLLPFFAYLGEARGITDDEIDALKRKLAELDARRDERSAPRQEPDPRRDEKDGREAPLNAGRDERDDRREKQP